MVEWSQTSTHVNVQTLALFPHPEHALQTSGEAVYVADVGVSTQELFAAPVESTCALSKLGKVDPAPALKLPGVVAFVGMCLFSWLLPFSILLFLLFCLSRSTVVLDFISFPSFSVIKSDLSLESFPLSLLSVFPSLLLLLLHSICLVFQNRPSICSEAAQLCSPHW